MQLNKEKLKSIMLSEVTEKDNHHALSHLWPLALNLAM